MTVVKPDTLRRASAVALFAVTIATIGLMWMPDFRVTALPELGAFVLAAAWLIAYLAGAERLRLSPVLVPVVAAALWPILQLAIGATIYRWATLLAALYWAAGAAVVFTGLQIFRDAALRTVYLRALVVAGFVVAIIAPLQLYTSDGKIYWLFETKYSNVAMGPFLYANQYAAFIELLLPVALTGVFTDRTGWRTFHGLAAAVMYASVIASASRSGFLLTTIEVLFVPLLAAKRSGIGWRQLASPAAMLLVMIVVLAFAVGPQKLASKILQKDPYAGRREYTESSLRMIRDNPLMGVGMGNWSAAYPAYATFDEGWFANQAHDDWAQWAAEGGLPFALLMLSVAALSFRGAFRTGWGMGVAVVFLQCFIDYPIQRMGVAVVFFSLISAIAKPRERGKAGGIVSDWSLARVRYE
jgi:O-antigen ligase